MCCVCTINKLGVFTPSQGRLPAAVNMSFVYHNHAIFGSLSLPGAVC